MELMDEPHLAWHLSGGTTELLRVTPEKKGGVHAERIGGTTDISAGQLIDRTGKLLGTVTDHDLVEAIRRAKDSRS